MHGLSYSQLFSLLNIWEQSSLCSCQAPNCVQNFEIIFLPFPRMIGWVAFSTPGGFYAVYALQDNTLEPLHGLV